VGEDQEARRRVVTGFPDLEARIAGGEPFSRADAERVLASPDLVSIGVLGERARQKRSGDRVTYGRVAELTAGTATVEVGEAGEVRIGGDAGSLDEVRARVHGAVAAAAGRPVTGFSLADLLALVGSDHLALAELARVLRADGLEAVAAVPLDRLGDSDNTIEVVRAVLHGGLGAWRVTVDRAPLAGRLDLIERAAELQRATGAVRAFAPLPRIDPPEAPSTGYDDVRTIAVARLVCGDIPHIQVDWPLYGPKLAQVAIAYGADDIDGVAAVDTLSLGHRRSPREDVERQIRAAFADPVERDGRYGVRA
jgi:aminodeoxyfutalosine synthase